MRGTRTRGPGRGRGNQDARPLSIHAMGPRHLSLLLPLVLACGRGAREASRPTSPTSPSDGVATREEANADGTSETEPLPAPNEEPTWPRAPSPPPPEAEPPTARVLGKKICVGVKDLPPERPHRAACCYPARELIARVVRTAMPAIRACYDRAPAEARAYETQLLMRYRIEQSGEVHRACADDGTLLDEDTVRCVLEQVRALRFPAQSAEEIALCGRINLAYPLRFVPEETGRGTRPP